MPPKRTRRHTLDSEETTAKRPRIQATGSQKSKSKKKLPSLKIPDRQQASEDIPSSSLSTDDQEQQARSSCNDGATSSTSEIRFSKLEKSVDDLKSSVEKIVEHLRVVRKVDEKTSKAREKGNSSDVNPVSSKKGTSGQSAGLNVEADHPERNIFLSRWPSSSRRSTRSGKVYSEISSPGTLPPSSSTYPNTSKSSRTSKPSSSKSPLPPNVTTPDEIGLEQLSIDDTRSVNLVKLAYLATRVEVKRKSTRESKKIVGEEVCEVFECALKEKSLQPVKTFIELQTSALINANYSNESDKKNWQPKSQFMCWFLSMKYLNMDTSSLEEVAARVRNLCGMKNIDEVEGAFRYNENLVMSNICDLMTAEQVIKLWELCSNEEEPMENFKMIPKSANLKGAGMKELIFFYIIRYLEMTQRFNTLFTDILLKYIGEIRSSLKREAELTIWKDRTDNLDQVCKILETYEIQVQPVGYCLVFCVKEGRDGAAQEIENIENTFEARLGYKVKVIPDPTLEMIATEAKKCSESASLGIYDSFVCFLLAHGDPEDIILFEGEKMSRKSFLRMFAKESCFPMKPKLFIMGSCQGEEVIVTADEKESKPNHHDRLDVPVPLIPDARRDIVTVHAESDRLVAYATLPNHAAFRNKAGGSYFVTFICEQIQELEKQTDPCINVVEVLQRANRKIHSILFKTEIKGVQGLGKQACYFESTLHKNFCFRLMEPKKK